MRDLLSSFRGALGIVWAVTVSVLLFAVPSFASEAGDAPADSPAGRTFRWVNFAIVFAGLLYVVVKWGAPAFRRHAEEISQKIAEGARAREAAEVHRAEIRAKLDGLEAEVEKMRVDAAREAEAEAQRLRSLSKREAQKIEDNAQAEIAAAIRAGQLALKSLAARHAIAQAEALLRKEIDATADSNLVRAFVKDLEGSVH
jgi:F-type H+-transporting ATPase subunit b